MDFVCVTFVCYVWELRKWKVWQRLWFCSVSGCQARYEESEEDLFPHLCGNCTVADLTEVCVCSVCVCVCVCELQYKESDTDLFLCLCGNCTMKDLTEVCFYSV